MRAGWLHLFAISTILTWAALLTAPARAENANVAQENAGAQDKEKHKEDAAQTKAAAKDHGGQKGGDQGPPIFLPIRIDLAIWTLVVFLLLLFVLSKYAWNPMLGALQKREQNIRSAIDEAQRAKDEAHQIREQLASERAKIADETRAAIDAARKDGQQLRDSMLAQAKADIQAERDRTRREIAGEKDRALKEIWDQTAQLATLVSAKAIRRELTPADHRRLVDEALADLQKAGGKQHA
jgi:F-type H+-transporting ATPase subunit b